VNPYELLRLAANLQCSTTEVIARFTRDGGTTLATRDDSACVFLAPNGCTVHPDRPLACRLYPLARIVHADGSEAFLEREPHPASEGVYGTDGSVAEYVESQGVTPYIAAAERYYAAFAQLLAASDSDLAPGAESATDVDARWFSDVHLAVQADSQRRGGTAPTDVDALVDSHLALIHRWTQQLTNEPRRIIS
jgi:Fe-S-cluster containining protein